MNLRRAASALACALVVVLAVGVSASAASAPAGKKQPRKHHVVAKKHPKKHAAKKKAVAAPKPVCLIGQSPQRGNSCTANPLFAKTICATFVPWLQAAAPGVQFPAGYGGGTAFGAVSCWWTVTGHKQAYGLQVTGLIGATGPQGQKWTPQQTFDWGFQDDTQVMNNPDNETCSDGVKSMVPKRTTVSGYQAYTEDPCAPDVGGKVDVLVGSVLFRANGLVSSAQLIPVVEQLIAKYKQHVPQG